MHHLQDFKFEKKVYISQRGKLFKLFLFFGQAMKGRKVLIHIVLYYFYETYRKGYLRI